MKKHLGYFSGKSEGQQTQPLSKKDKEMIFWVIVFVGLGYLWGVLDHAGIPLGGLHH